jgi:hypothetical protein
MIVVSGIAQDKVDVIIAHHRLFSRWRLRPISFQTQQVNGLFLPINGFAHYNGLSARVPTPFQRTFRGILPLVISAPAARRKPGFYYPSSAAGKTSTRTGLVQQ